MIATIKPKPKSQLELIADAATDLRCQMETLRRAINIRTTGQERETLRLYMRDAEGSMQRILKLLGV